MDHEEKLAARALANNPESTGGSSRIGSRASSSEGTSVSEGAKPVSSKVGSGNKVGAGTKVPAKKKPNNVRQDRIERMMSKAELARRANLSVLTIDRVEKGFGCRMDTKRKILEALGLSLADRVRVFGEEE